MSKRILKHKIQDREAAHRMMVDQIAKEIIRRVEAEQDENKQRAKAAAHDTTAANGE